jgi:hypothetical protein
VFLLARQGFLHSFSMMSYFSRLCVIGLFGAATWSLWTFIRITVAKRRSLTGGRETAQTRSDVRVKFDGVFYLSELLAVACIADLLFSFIFDYMARAVDVNPWPTLVRTWGAAQCVFIVLLLIHSLRWYVWKVTLNDSGQP